MRDWDREEPEQAGLLHVEIIELETSANYVEINVRRLVRCCLDCPS